MVEKLFSGKNEADDIYLLSVIATKKQVSTSFNSLSNKTSHEFPTEFTFTFSFIKEGK